MVERNLLILERSFNQGLKKVKTESVSAWSVEEVNISTIFHSRVSFSPMASPTPGPNTQVFQITYAKALTLHWTPKALYVYCFVSMYNY